MGNGGAGLALAPFSPSAAFGWLFLWALEMADGFTESVTIDEGVNSQGIRTQFHFESDGGLVLQETFDAAPHLEYAKRARESTEGKNWGEGRLVGHIPPMFYKKIMTIKDRDEREKAIWRFLQENPAFKMFHKA